MEPELVLPVPANFSITDAARETLASARAAPNLKPTRINTSIPIMCTTVLAAVRDTRPFRDVMRASLPEYDLAEHDRLELYGYGLYQLHMQHLAVAEGPSGGAAERERCAELNGIFRAEIATLARRKLVSDAFMQNLKGGPGHRNNATDLGTMAAFLVGAWPQIAGKTGISPAELAEAPELVKAVLGGVVDREANPEEGQGSGHDRLIAYQLLRYRYGQLRRTMSWIRWDEGDFAHFTPALPALGSARRRDDEEAQEDELEPAPPSTASSAAPVAVPDVAPAPIAPGMPGANPYMR